MTSLPSYRDLPRRGGLPAAWGLWGPDADVLGCLNMLTPERVVAATRLVQKGSVFALNWSMGLPDPDHYASARDLAILTRAMIGEFPEYYKWHSIKEFMFNNIKQVNRNRLLWRDSTVDGVKTGHTQGAGYCLVTSALRDNMRLIAVVMGTKSDNERANANQALLNYGFRFYETRPLYKANESLGEARVWKGAESKVPVGLSQNFAVTFPRGQYANLKASLEIDTGASAPVKQGDKLGTVKVVYNGETMAEQNLVALKAVEEGGIVRRLIDQVLLMFKK